MQKRFADDVAPADYDSAFAVDFDSGEVEHFNATGGRARNERGTSGDEFADVDGVKAVDIFARVDAVQNFFRRIFYRGGQRQLHQNPVNVRICVERVNFREQLPQDFSYACGRP